jgi:hypothetical protein
MHKLVSVVAAALLSGCGLDPGPAASGKANAIPFQYREDYEMFAHVIREISTDECPVVVYQTTELDRCFMRPEELRHEKFWKMCTNAEPRLDEGVIRSILEQNDTQFAIDPSFIDTHRKLRLSSIVPWNDEQREECKRQGIKEVVVISRTGYNADRSVAITIASVHRGWLNADAYAIVCTRILDKWYFEKKPRHQNLWVNSGSGSFPRM